MSGSANQRTGLLVDRHPIWLDTVAQVIARANVHVVGTLSSSAKAERALTELRPDLLVTGIDMPDGELDGIELVRRARQLVPGIRTLVLSMHEDEQHIAAAFGAGADAYVVKTAQPEDLASAVRQTFKHSIYLHRAVFGAAHPTAADGVSLGLTPREMEILRLVAEGHSNAHVARTLWVSEQTVKFHLSNVYRKVGVSNRTEASRWAQLQGLLTAPALSAAA